jgi:hypothetical protein
MEDAWLAFYSNDIKCFIDSEVKEDITATAAARKFRGAKY